jgi:hypothetical protein
MKSAEYNKEIFSSIRQEINQRISIHYTMMFGKYAVLGAVLAFLIKDGSNLQVSPLLLAALTSMLLDLVIVENLGWVHSAGHFIKTRVEAHSDGIIRWESDFAQHRGRWVCFTSSSYIFGTWIVAPFLFILHFFSPWNALAVTDLAKKDGCNSLNWGDKSPTSVNGLLILASIMLAGYSLRKIRDALEPRADEGDAENAGH